MPRRWFESSRLQAGSVLAGCLVRSGKLGAAETFRSIGLQESGKLSVWLAPAGNSVIRMTLGSLQERWVFLTARDGG